MKWKNEKKFSQKFQKKFNSTQLQSHLVLSGNTKIPPDGIGAKIPPDGIGKKNCISCKRHTKLSPASTMWCPLLWSIKLRANLFSWGINDEILKCNANFVQLQYIR